MYLQLYVCDMFVSLSVYMWVARRVMDQGCGKWYSKLLQMTFILVSTGEKNNLDILNLEQENVVSNGKKP